MNDTFYLSANGTFLRTEENESEMPALAGISRSKAYPVVMQPRDDSQEAKRRASNLRLAFSLEYARDSFYKVRDTVALYRKYNVTFEHELFYTFISSIVLTYARPFNASKMGNVISLPEKYEKFEDAQMQHVHDGLINSRNTIYAHPNYGEIAQLIVNYKAEGRTIAYTSGHSLIQLRDVIVPNIDALLDYQHQRIMADLQEKLDNVIAIAEVAEIMIAQKANSLVVTYEHPKAQRGRLFKAKRGVGL